MDYAFSNQTGCHEFLVSWVSTDFTDAHHQYPHICVCGEGDVYYIQRLGHYLGLKILFSIFCDFFYILGVTAKLDYMYLCWSC